MNESAPRDEKNQPSIEVFTDDELKKLKDANKRYKAGELQKLLKRIKALDALDAAYDEKAATMRANLRKQLGKYSITNVSKTKVNDDDNSEDKD